MYQKKWAAGVAQLLSIFMTLNPMPYILYNAVLLFFYFEVNGSVLRVILF